MQTDTTKYTSDSSPMVLEYSINSDLSLLSTWFESNYLQINATKTQAIAMGSLSYKYEFKLDDSDIQVSETLKILGVTLDRGLTFRTHIAEQLIASWNIKLM